MLESIIMTVSDREPELLMSTLRWLSASDLSDSEIIIVNDNSRVDYTWIMKAYDGLPIKWIDLEPYGGYSVPEENFNNPAKAFNVALSAATGERLLILSSDVIVPPRVIDKARQSYDPKTIYCPMVIDLGTSDEYCGPHRPFPMPWFLYCERASAIAVGGWDENYLLGLCWEDNDFVGRLALYVGSIMCDWQSIVWHQSHRRIAYEQGEWLNQAKGRNRQYTADKWQGVPFAGADVAPMAQSTSRHEGTGMQLLVFKDTNDILQEVINKTESQFTRGVVESEVAS